MDSIFWIAFVRSPASRIQVFYELTRYLLTVVGNALGIRFEGIFWSMKIRNIITPTNIDFIVLHIFGSLVFWLFWKKDLNWVSAYLALRQKANDIYGSVPAAYKDTKSSFSQNGGMTFATRIQRFKAQQLTSVIWFGIWYPDKLDWI